MRPDVRDGVTALRPASVALHGGRLKHDARARPTRASGPERTRGEPRPRNEEPGTQTLKRSRAAPVRGRPCAEKMPGIDLLSRRKSVSLAPETLRPSSRWDRVFPSGYGHRAKKKRNRVPQVHLHDRPRLRSADPAIAREGEARKCIRRRLEVPAACVLGVEPSDAGDRTRRSVVNGC